MRGTDRLNERQDFMKKTTMAAIVGGILFAAALPSMALDVFQQNARLGRGVNILGWDAIWREPARSKFKDAHFKSIREAGFNHVRINLHPLRDGKPDADGKLRAEFFKTMDWAVDQALANGLLAILDYHDDLAISPDPEGKKKDFLASWSAIAEHCKDRPDTVLFEILNEPAAKFTHESWDGYWHAALAIIRQSNPSRTVILGPNPWNGVGELDSLKLPEGDRNIIATVHYYNPFPFTHQGTPWTGQKDKLGVTWTGTEAELKAVEKDFSKVAEWAKRNNRPIYIGEFGTYEKAEMNSRVRWTAHIGRQMEKNGWSWGFWQFANDFALFDMETQKWVEPIRDALIPKKKD
jgi:endoglucanase